MDDPTCEKSDRFQLPRMQGRRFQQRLWWMGRLQSLRRIPAPVTLGLIFSLLCLLIILFVPTEPDVPLFLPLLVAGACCAAITLHAVYRLALGLLYQRLERETSPIFPPPGEQIPHHPILSQNDPR